jgi:hypothetical protein
MGFRFTSSRTFLFALALSTVAPFAHAAQPAPISLELAPLPRGVSTIPDFGPDHLPATVVMTDDALLVTVRVADWSNIVVAERSTGRVLPNPDHVLGITIRDGSVVRETVHFQPGARVVALARGRVGERSGDFLLIATRPPSNQPSPVTLEVYAAEAERYLDSNSDYFFKLSARWETAAPYCLAERAFFDAFGGNAEPPANFGDDGRCNQRGTDVTVRP